jgi:hypothetical protein
VKAAELRRALQTVPLPDEFEARRRSWPVVQAAHAEHEPARRRRVPVRTLLVAAAALALLAAVLSPQGMAVIERVREAIGVADSQPALFSLPAPGRLLVVSDAGPWVVHPDGSKRRLGRWREASWSPFGRFVVAARRNELAALEPDGDVRWKLARRDVRFPRWGGTRTDTRIAYLSGRRLHVVGGDGRGDAAARLPRAAPVAPAWRPGARHVLAYVSERGRVHVYDTGARREVWRSRRFPGPRLLAWSDDGARLLLVTADGAVVFGAGGPRPLAVHGLPGVVDAAFAPGARSVALARASDVLVAGADRAERPPRTIFAGAGRFTDVAWSPDGRWLLVAWRDADQWVFVRSAGERRIEAVSDVASQFESRRFPRVETWCCAR